MHTHSQPSLNVSLLNLSFKSEDQLDDKGNTSEAESEASNYIDYLDNFAQKFNHIVNQTFEKSEHVLKQENEFADDEFLNFEEDSNQDNAVSHIDNPVLAHDSTSFNQENRPDWSALNKNISLINLNAIPEELEVSFNFNKHFLSLLNDEKEGLQDDSFDSPCFDELAHRKGLSKFIVPRIKAPHHAVNASSDAFFELEVANSNGKKSIFRVSGNGVVGSLKDTTNDDVLVGRAFEILGNVHPNDIPLREDLSLSRLHMRLITKYFFGKPTQLSRKFACLMHVLSRNKHKLSKLLLAQVLSFLRKPRVVFLQDLGSSCGTFVRVKDGQSMVLEPHVEFRLGCQASFIVVPVRALANWTTTQKRPQAACFANAAFYGFTNIEEELFVQNGKPMFLILQTKNCPSQLPEFLIFNPVQGVQFRFGRNDKADVCISLADVSKIQATLCFDGSHWRLGDGKPGKPSINGCWGSVKKRDAPRRLSEKIPLCSGDQIMIGTHAIKFYFN